MARCARAGLRWGALWLLLSSGAAGAALAQQRGPVPPAEPVAAKAFAILERHCARCHQQGRLERGKPAGNFGNVLQLEQLVWQDRLVHGGNPDGSRLWTHMMRRLMPHDVYQEPSGRSGPEPEEILAVRDWIEAEQPPAVRRGARLAKTRGRDLRSGQKAEPALFLAVDKSVHARGDVVTLRISSTAECRLMLVGIDVRGRGTVLFPNELETSNVLAPNQELVVPAPDAAYLLRVKEPGRERVVALCALGAGVPDGIRHDFERQRFTDLGDYRAFLAKAIAGEAIKSPPAATARRGRARGTPAPQPEPAAAPHTVLRTGVTFEVR